MARPVDYTPKNAWFGLLFMAAGAAMMVFMALDQTGLNAPLWVAEAAGGCFLFAGAAVTAQCFGLDRLGRTFGLMTVYCLTVIPFWIVFGDSGGNCTVSAGGVLLPQTFADLTCRGAFGISAGLMLLCAFAMTFAALKPKKRPA